MNILLGAYNIRSLNEDEQWESTGPGNLWTAWAIVQSLVKTKAKATKSSTQATGKKQGTIFPKELVL